MMLSRSPPPPPLRLAAVVPLLLLLLPTLAAAAAAAGDAPPYYTAAAEADRVRGGLPGAPADAAAPNMFSGYVTVDNAANRALFYAFVEAAVEQPWRAPVLLWLNGGPGCSSIGGGFMAELGPYFPTSSGHALAANPYAWHLAGVNVLFLESPAFVGFSYSDDPKDAAVGDERAARDARAFVLRWLRRFPGHRSADFYIAGESYGGHYVPGLALEILRGNRRRASGHVNLKGIFVGNAWTDAETDNRGALDFWYSHAMVGAAPYQGIKESCDFSRIGPLLRRPRPAGVLAEQQAADGAAGAAAGGVGDGGDREQRCAHWLEVAQAEIEKINIYQIYAPVCTRGSNGDSGSNNGGNDAGRRYVGALLGWQRQQPPRPPRTPRYDPCIDGEVEEYLNQPAVQAALHANTSAHKLPWRWTDCTDRIAYSYDDLLSSMLPTWRALLADGSLKLWVYSGDIDGIVPVLGSRRWVENLGLPELAPGWRAWSSGTGQVGGWRVDYGSSGAPSPSVPGGGAEEDAPPVPALTFATVRGAGHMVPYVQPERAFYLLQEFLRAPVPVPAGGGGPAPAASSRVEAEEEAEEAAAATVVV